MFHFASISTCPVLNIIEKSLDIFSLDLPFRLFIYVDSYIQVLSEPSVLQAKQTQIFLPFLTGEVLQSLDHFWGPPLDFFHYVHVCLCRKPAAVQSTPDVVSGVLSRGKGLSPLTCLQQRVMILRWADWDFRNLMKNHRLTWFWWEKLRRWSECSEKAVSVI